jgi:RimJ/RimL family protein N-acetyltransferase
MTDITVRPIHDHEWQEVRALRLRALQDEVASIAFVDTFEEASVPPDEFWQQRAHGSSVEAGANAGVRSFIAIAGDGAWIGSVTVIVEKVGEKDFEGNEIVRDGGAIVGVYLDPEYRGRGVIQRLFDAALDWVRERELGYARLYVHSDNLRAQGAYLRAGFTPTGASFEGSLGAELEMAREVEAPNVTV